MSESGDNIAHLTIEILRGIRTDIQKTNADTNARIDALTLQTVNGHAALQASLDSLEHETIRGFQGVHKRLDDVTGRLENLRDFSGERWRDHETRLERLEQRVGVEKPGE